MTNEEIQEIVAKADDEYDRLKDRVHEQYDEIKRLNNIINEIIKCIDSLYVPYETEETWEFYGKEYDDREKVIEEIKKLKGSDKE